MLKKAEESLLAAGILLKQGFTDFAASRAYYGMFYVAEALLFNLGYTYSSHSAVLAAFGKEFARTRLIDPSFHQYLILAQEYRQQGDYSKKFYFNLHEVRLENPGLYPIRSE